MSPSGVLHDWTVPAVTLTVAPEVGTGAGGAALAICRKHEHFGGRGDFENLASGLQTIEDPWHCNVHQNQCGAKILGQVECLKAVYRLAHDFKIIFQF